MYKNLLICPAVFLAACGGSDSGGGSGGLPSPETYVAGEFRDASVEGRSYPSGLLYAGGQNGRQCQGETHYFETEDGRIRVYGSTAFSDTDYQVVATMIHNRLDGVLDKFGMTWDEFVAQRPLFHLDVLSDLVSLYGTMNPDELGEPVRDEDGFEIFGVPEWQLWSSLSGEDQLAFAEAQASFFAGAESLNDLLLPGEVLAACFSSEMSGAMFGEGSQLGIQIPPHTSTYHSRVGEIFTHEIVHFVQANIGSVGGNPFSVYPRWFSEGQAVYLAGQSLAGKGQHYQSDPVGIVTFDDEIDTGEDSGFLYRHYGLAYSYIDQSSGRNAVVQMMQDMKGNTPNPLQPGMNDQSESEAFVKAFESRIKDHEGSAMTLERYRSEYHDLMNRWE